MAHQSAAAYIHRIWPLYQAIGVPVYLNLPIGHHIDGIQPVINLGANAHQGLETIVRYQQVMKWAATNSDHDDWSICEYDAFPLKPILPTDPGPQGISGIATSRRRICRLTTPWRMRRSTALKFAMAPQLRGPVKYTGAIDYWFHVMANQLNLPVVHNNAIDVFTHLRLGTSASSAAVRTAFRQCPSLHQATWIHGLKKIDSIEVMLEEAVRLAK